MVRFSRGRFYLPGLLFAPMFFAALIACFPARAQSREAVLRTRQTILRVRAGDHEPAIVSLASPGEAAWTDSAAQKLIDRVEVNDRIVPIHWTYDARASRITPGAVAYVYESASPHLRLTWKWQARAGFGPIEHSIRIENLEGREVWLPLQASLQTDWRVNTLPSLTHFYVEKGADTPSPDGTHQVPLADEYSWRGYSSTYAHPRAGFPREIIPWSVVYRNDAAQSGWYMGLEFSGRAQLSLNRAGDVLRARAGLDPEPGPFLTRLPSAGSFETPVAFLGAFTGGPDGAGNVLRPWVRHVLGNPHTWQDPHYPLTVNNSWGSGMAVDAPLARRMIRESAELGLEMFHLDAGWFRGVGDWYADSKKFPDGLAVIADDAHRHGLKFGIWVDWTQAGTDTKPGALNIHDARTKNWLVTDLPTDWKPEEFKGETIDIGVPAAHDYALHEVRRIVADNHLDMLEHDGYLVAQGCVKPDHPHAPPDMAHMSIQKDSGFRFVYSSNSTDVSYHAVRAYYDIYERLRREHPGLLFEICNDGGRMVDFGSAAHGDYFSITDTYDPLSNRRAFYDTSFALPPAMLEAYVEKWQTTHIENFLYMLRSGMMGWLSVMQDTTAWTAEQHAAAKEEIALYKSRLRPLIRDASLYHVSQRPDGVHWDGIEYYNAARGTGVLYAFRGSVPDEDSHAFVLKGLDRARLYRLHFHDGSAPDRTVSGRELLATGIAVRRGMPNSSELVFFESVPETHR
jgi:hypothetical protein